MSTDNDGYKSVVATTPRTRNESIDKRPSWVGRKYIKISHVCKHILIIWKHQITRMMKLILCI